MNPFRNILPAAALILPLLPLVARAETILFRDTFDHRHAGPIQPGGMNGSDVVAWEGPTALEYGWVGITDDYPGAAKDTRDHGNVVVFHDNASAPNQGPSLQISWAGKAPSSGHVVLEWKFLVPEAGSYTGIFFLGKDWNSAAAVIVLSGGAIVVYHDSGDADRKMIGSYTPGKWQTIKADLNVGARTFDTWVGGKQALTAAAWLATAPPTVDLLSIVADFSTTDHSGGPVLYLDDVKVLAVP